MTKGLETIPEQEWLLKGPEIRGPKKRSVRECIGSPAGFASQVFSSGRYAQILGCSGDRTQTTAT